MVTIQEVAQRAGVSVGSVSRYLNGYKQRPENAKKIAQAIEELNYTVNYWAKSLKSSKSYSIGLLMSNMLSNYSTGIVATIEKIFEAAGYGTLLTDYRDDPEQIEKKLQFLLSRGIDGLIMVSVESDWKCRKAIEALPIPVVSLVTPFYDSQIIDSVIVDDFQSTKDCLKQIITNYGHKNVGCIIAPQTDYVARQRYTGILSAYKEAETECGELSKHFYFGKYTRESGRQGVKYLLENPDITCIFVTNYNMSLGAIRGISEQKYLIGKDISFAGYDYFDLGDVFYPKISVIRQPISQLGEKAAKRILERLADPDQEAVVIKMKNKILWQDSVAQLTD